jgi:aminopeptidase
MRKSESEISRYATLLVDYSIGVQPGWQVLVATTTEAEPLARELSRLIGERGAYALQRISFGARWPVDADWLCAAPELGVAPAELELYDRIDALIVVTAPRLHGPTPPSAAMRRTVSALRARGHDGGIPHVRCDFPCAFFARAADLTLEEYERLFCEACLRDWEAEGRKMEPVRAALDEARELRIEAPGTDLRLSLEGRCSEIDDGHVNVPGGEVFCCPVEESAEGEVVLESPSGNATGIRLRFEAGEKIAGTIHLALGSGFPRLGGRNVSDVHWDLLRDMREGGRVTIDGRLAYENGVWL